MAFYFGLSASHLENHKATAAMFADGGESVTLPETAIREDRYSSEVLWIV
ncbi:hypothetical protein [Bacillus smithii]|nr:hypothetical protein [Bacillus smithii]